MEGVPYALPAMIIICVAVAAASGGPSFVSRTVSFLRRVQRRERVVAHEGDHDGAHARFHKALLVDLLRNGIPSFGVIRKLLLKQVALKRFCTRIRMALRIKGYVATLHTACDLMALIWLISGLLSICITASPFTALLIACASLVVLSTFVRKTLRTWEAQLHAQIPDALRSIGVCFASGLSLVQAFEQTARDTPDPLGSELKRTALDIAAGRSVEESLQALERRTSARSLQFVALALEVQHRVGGSLQDLLEGAAASVASTLELQRSLEVQTTQARLSARIVAVMPLCLLIILSLVSDGYFQSFFASSTGTMLFLLAAAMEAAGVVVIRRILSMEVT